MPVDGLGLFERLLALPDPDLQDMILHPSSCRPASSPSWSRRCARFMGWRRIASGTREFARPSS